MNISYEFDLRKITLIFCAYVVFFTISPLVALLLVLVFFSSISLNSKSGFIVLFFSLLAISPYIALKSDVSFLGNDKHQYIEYLYLMKQGRFSDLLSVQPEVVSFGIFALFSFIEEPNWFFFVYFSLSLFFLYWGLYFFDNKSLCLFLLLFLSSSFFLLTYGNVIRQGLSISFMICVLGSYGINRLKYILLSMFSHFSSFFLIVNVFIEKYWLRPKVWQVLFLSLISYILGKYIQEILFLFSSFSSAYISNKSELYSNWHGYDISSSIITFLIMFCMKLIIWIYSGFLFIFDETEDKKRIVLFKVLVILSSILLLTIDVPKIFERFYIYYYVLFFLYLSFHIVRMKFRRFNSLTVTSISILLSLLVIKRFSSTPWFYLDRPMDFLNDTIFVMYSYLL